MDTIRCGLTVVGLVACAWFFQGPGWSQWSHYGTIRALVEDGSFQINRFSHLTRDVSVIDDRIYSNKPPGLPLIGAPLYLLIRWTTGVDASTHDSGLMWAMTFLLSGVPTVVTAVLVYQAVLRRGIRRRTAAILALVFLLGTLQFAYAGVMFNHSLVAMLVLGAWLAVTATPSRPMLAGLCMGLAGLVEYLALPMAGVLLVLAWAGGARNAARMMLGMVPGLAALAWFQQTQLGWFLWTTYRFENPELRDESLFMGKFHWPDWRVLYWISWHRFRGLLVCCPIFLTALAAPLVARRRPGRVTVGAIAIILIPVLFTMCYLQWDGGWGVGPRFLIPVLPLLYLLGVEVMLRWPCVAGLLGVLSVFNMFAVASVEVMYPSYGGPPQHLDPVHVAHQSLVSGQVARTEGSMNLGLILGLKGGISALPALVPAALYAALVMLAGKSRGFRPPRPAASTASSGA